MKKYDVKNFKIDPRFTRNKALPGIADQVDNFYTAKNVSKPKDDSSPLHYNAALVEGNQQTHDKFMNAAAAANLPLRHKTYYQDATDERNERRKQMNQDYHDQMAEENQNMQDGDGTTTTTDGITTDKTITETEGTKKTDTTTEGELNWGDDYDSRVNMGDAEEKRLQQFLLDKGYDVGPKGADTKWGKNSEAAYQKYLEDQKNAAIIQKSKDEL